MRLGDRALGLLTMLGGVLLLIASMQFSPLPGQKYGAEALPELVAALAIVVGICLLVQGLRHERGMALIALQEWTHERGAWLRLVGAVVVILAYILTLDWLGFTLASTLLLLAMLLLTGTKPLLALVVAIIAVLAVQFAFGSLLMVPLPRGEIISLPW